MSGEFGSYTSGYFHTQMDVASGDVASGRLESTRVWADFLANFAKVAKAISWAEEYDSSEATSIRTMIEKMPALKADLEKIEGFLRPYQEVADAAVRKHIEDHS